MCPGHDVVTPSLNPPLPVTIPSAFLRDSAHSGGTVRDWLLVTGVALIACASPVLAADTANAVATPLKAPDCIMDPQRSFFAENTQPAEPPHPTLPIGRYYQIVRFLGNDSISAPADFDFGHFPASYPWPPARGLAVTGLAVPEPRFLWQRAAHPDATVDTSSGFQLHCYDAGSFINSWTFAPRAIDRAGPHSIYGYSFDAARSPPIYDDNAQTDFVLQASVEIPWFAAWPAPGAPPDAVLVGQVSLFAYLRDRNSGKTFALLFAIFDNRYSADPTYPAFVAHDAATPFASMPISAGTRYATRSPYSSAFTGDTWTGLRFFRAQVSQPDFRRVLADINAYCQAHRTERYCPAVAPDGSAYSLAVTDYEITDFGVLHEIFGGGPAGNISMGVHVYDLGAWNLR